jgi:hypothetical protein
MTWGIRGRALVVSSLFLLIAAGAAFADARQEFAQETGLDPNLIGVIQTDVNGTEMTVVFVFINDRALDSRISPALRQELLPYVGRNALYVNPSVRSVVDRLGFDWHAIAVQAEGGRRFVPPATAWVEITPGFLNGTFQMNPAGTSQGSGSEAILVLGNEIDPVVPFTVTYGAASATFDVAAGPTSAAESMGSTSALSHEPITVPALEDVTSLEDVLALSDLTPDSLALLFGLDRSLVRLLDVPVKTETIRMVFVRLEESVQTNSLGSELLERLDSVIGTGAVMVFVWSATAPSFSPWYFYIQQSGTNHVFFSDASFVELTTGFLDLTHLVPGELAAAVIRLPKSVNPLRPFSVFYSALAVAYP